MNNKNKIPTPIKWAIALIILEICANIGGTISQGINIAEAVAYNIGYAFFLIISIILIIVYFKSQNQNTINNKQHQQKSKSQTTNIMFKIADSVLKSSEIAYTETTRKFIKDDIDKFFIYAPNNKGTIQNKCVAKTPLDLFLIPMSITYFRIFKIKEYIENVTKKIENTNLKWSKIKPIVFMETYNHIKSHLSEDNCITSENFLKTEYKLFEDSLDELLEKIKSIVIEASNKQA